MIEEFGLTLPPETEPLQKSRRDTHLGWRKDVLDRAHRERISAERLRCCGESVHPPAEVDLGLV